MPSVTVKKGHNSLPHFITLTVKNWYYIFDRHHRWEILLDSLRFSQEKKNLKISAWVFMINHIHLIVQSDDVSKLLRDFKTVTSKELQKNITATEPNVLDIFIDEDGKYQLWQPKNMPKAIEANSFFEQKVQYITDNLVRKTYVNNPEDWKWSSANPWNLLYLEYPWDSYLEH